jgi:hypothetical protein
MLAKNNYLNTNRQKAVRSLGELQNPIQAEIKSVSNNYLQTFQDYNLVPFGGVDVPQSHAKYIWLIDLINRSPTHAACVRAKIDFSFSGFIDVQKNEPLLIPSKSEGLNDAIKQEYTEALQNVKFQDGCGFLDFSKKIALSLETSGNAFVKLSYTIVEGQVFTALSAFDSSQVLYKATEDGKQKKVVVSPYFDYQNFEESKVEIYPVTELYDSELTVVKKGGYFCTVLHLKNEAVSRKFYGVPSWIAAFKNMYKEDQSSTYNLKAAERGFQGALFLEFEEAEADDFRYEDQEADMFGGFDARNLPSTIDERNNALANTFTNTGKRQSLIATSERPAGASPFKAFQVALNTNESYYNVMAALDEKAILKAHNLSSVLLGGEAAKSGLNGSAFYDEFKQRDLTTFKPLQKKVSDFLNNLVKKCFKLSGEKEELQTLSFKYISHFQFEEIKKLDADV